MLSTNKNQTYYAISSCYNIPERKLITTICETDGLHMFDFNASYEKVLDNDLNASIKKLKSYSFTASEFGLLKQQLAQQVIDSTNSILAENNMLITDIDFICIGDLSISDELSLNISHQIFKQLQTPVISDLVIDRKEDFLKILAESKNLESGLIIDLDENFDIYSVNDTVSSIGSTMGFSVLRYLSLYSNIEADKISYLIAQGEVDMAIINKLSEIDNLESLQKELINMLVFSKIDIEDKLRTAFFVIKSLLLKDLAEFDNNTPIMLIGNTVSLELINVAVKEKFENVTFLKNQSQRQNTFSNEELSYFACKKYAVDGYNNGVKLS